MAIVRHRTAIHPEFAGCGGASPPPGRSGPDNGEGELQAALKRVDPGSCGEMSRHHQCRAAVGGGHGSTLPGGRRAVDRLPRTSQYKSLSACAQASQSRSTKSGTSRCLLSSSVAPAFEFLGRTS